ncbi:hypothetical protein DYB37_005299 [Aphanomyces astaci]|nr:hypothetical protein DYB37_005299 [Aphanomyces astaci]
MDISFPRTQNKWSISKRYSDFFKLRRALGLMLKQTNRMHDTAWLPLKLVSEATTAAFPRRHLRNDTVAIIQERRIALKWFVHVLVKIMCSFPPDMKLHGTLMALHALLKEFLRFPDEQLHKDAKRTLAILALEDVVVASSSTTEIRTDGSSSDCCSICLGEWNEVEYADMRVVKLPCSHVFHEECVLDWLGVSSECPLCRTDGATPIC